MIKKWEVVPAPSEKNQNRHKLLIKGDMKDIFLVVKKLGGICSRPEKTAGGFDYLIYLSHAGDDVTAKLEGVAGGVGSVSKAPAPSAAPFQGFYATAQQAAPAPAPAPEPEVKLSLEPRPAVAPQAPVPQYSAPAPLPQPAPAPMPAPAPQYSAPAPAPRFEPAPMQMQQAFSAPAPAPQPAPPPAAEQTAPAPAAPALHPGVTQPRQGFVPSVTMRAKVQDMAAAASRPAAAPAAASPAPAPRPSFKIKSKWSMELPLIPTYNFHTLVSGSHNRFAHAAAMAVVENPGMIYNPLLVFGLPGTGKTHFINAISNGIAASSGQGSIFVTDGVKFSKGVDLAIQEGGIAKLESLFAGIKTLIIDDVHLMILSDANKPYISKWLNDFVAKNKQIVVTSVLPPKALAGLEDAVGFQFTQGWMVDLKVPPPQTYKVILNQLLQGMEVKTSEVELSEFFLQKAMPFGEAISVLEGMKKLEKFIVNPNNNLTHAQLLEMMFGLQESFPPPPDAGDIQAAVSWKASDQDEWFKWGVFFPAGAQQEAQFAMYALHERARQLGINTQWKQVFMHEYDPGELYSSPFNIGNFASSQNVNGVVVLGAPPSTAVFEKEAEFRHICLKILDSFSVKSAWLPMEKLKSPAAQTRALMDLV